MLQRAGVIFQYGSAITLVSYLSRSILVDGHELKYRKIKQEILVQTKGVDTSGNINIATSERAFVDLLYLEKDFYFDNLHVLEVEKIIMLLIRCWRN